MKNQKRTWVYDGLIQAVRNSGNDNRDNYTPINRSSLKEMAVKVFVEGCTDAKGKTDVGAVIEAMKKYHGSNPIKAQSKIAKLEAKLAEAKAAAKAAGLKV